jgi:uncharacterized membrane protein
MSDLPPIDPVPPATPDPTPTGATPPAVDVSPDAADAEKNKIMAILAYLGILVLVPLLAAKESRFARYHANQGLILLITSVCGGIAMVIIALISAFIPYVGPCMSCVVYIAFMVGILTLVIMGIINAANGKMKPLPVIGKFTILK